MSAEPTAYFAVMRDHGANWNDALFMRQQEQWDEHARFMDALVDDGFIVLGGMIGEGQTALLIIRAGNAAEIRSRLADDPWTHLDLLRITRIDRWEILLGAIPK
ncbi:MAG TPA: hypothetical protein VH349_17870 [Ktedonobacterales bacterium]|jgi:hypothetical protein